MALVLGEPWHFNRSGGRQDREAYRRRRPDCLSGGRIAEAFAGLLDLKKSIAVFMREHGWDSRLSITIHFGTLLAGPFGTSRERRYDVIGKHVNAAAKLEHGGMTLSVAGLRKIEPGIEKTFQEKCSAGDLYSRRKPAPVQALPVIGWSRRSV